MINKFIFLKDIFSNIFFSHTYKLFYVVENANWSTDWDGKNTVNSLNARGFVKGRITSTHIGLRNKIIHFGSTGTLITNRGIKQVHQSNKVILTWFHVTPGDTRVQYIPQLNDKVVCVHTACTLTKDKLLHYGLLESHIVVIPLGVDLHFFKPSSGEEKSLLREKMGIPEELILVGSFQKDGDGWGEGMVPKYIKGPDIFCSVVERLAKKYRIHVILTGPSRGYVKEGLRRLGISFSHTYLHNYYDIVPYYQILDCYIISSREEGGPKALLESMACGVPVISTNVGMVPEIIENGENGYMVTETTADTLYEVADVLLGDRARMEHISKNGLQKVQGYTIEQSAQLYWEKIYAPILKK